MLPKSILCRCTAADLLAYPPGLARSRAAPRTPSQRQACCHSSPQGAASMTSSDENCSSMEESDEEVQRQVNDLLQGTMTEAAIRLPPPPDLQGLSVRARWNATSLAFLGDAVWELYIRRHFFVPPARTQLYCERVKQMVTAEAQAQVHVRLVQQQLLTPQEAAVLKWGRNRGAGATQPKRFASDMHTYKQASAVETLVGFLYLTDPDRLTALLSQLDLNGPQGQGKHS